MLEVIIPGIRHGEGKLNSSTAYQGNCCYLAGVDADGYQLLQVPYSSAQAAKSIYPINKYYLSEDYSDTSDSVDKLTLGDTIIYYEGGEYETDRIDANSFGLTPGYWESAENPVDTAYGPRLYVPGSSTAHGTTGLRKVYVTMGKYTTANAGTIAGSTPSAYTTIERDGSHIGFVTGIHYSDSSDARVRFRIMPGTEVNGDAFAKF